MCVCIVRTHGQLGEHVDRERRQSCARVEETGKDADNEPLHDADEQQRHGRLLSRRFTGIWIRKGKECVCNESRERTLMTAMSM